MAKFALVVLLLLGADVAGCDGKGVCEAVEKGVGLHLG